jgi:hypothetical protein
MAGITFPYTRTPKGAAHSLTVGRAVELGVDPEGGKWVTLCDEHNTLVNTGTQLDALAVTALDFCEFCQAEAAGVSDMSIEFAKDEEAAVELTAEQAKEVDEALAHASAVIAAAEQVVADHAVETSAEHAAILAEIADAPDHATRDAAIVKGAQAGIPRKVLADTAGLIRVGRIIRDAGAGRTRTPRAARKTAHQQGYLAAVEDVRAIVEANRNVKERVAAWVLDHTDAPAEAPADADATA